jgi:hypothetical protein
MENDDRRLACRFLATLVDVVFVLSNETFQRSVWLYGNHPKRYVSSYDETAEMFQENLEWLTADGLWQKAGISERHIDALRRLFTELDRFDHGKRGRDPADILDDPGWRVIVTSAKAALGDLADNACGASPSVS